MVDFYAVRSERSVHLAEVEGADVPLRRAAGSLGFGDRPGELPAPGGWSRIAWAAGDQVGALAADAGSGSELGKLMGGAAVERERSSSASSMADVWQARSWRQSALTRRAQTSGNSSRVHAGLRRGNIVWVFVAV